MKMTSSRFSELKKACECVLIANPGAVEHYRSAGLSHERLRWDVFHAAQVDCYGDGLNDSHIDTALRRIVPSY